MPAIHGFGRAATIGLVAGGALASLIGAIRTLSSHPETFGLDLTAYIEAARRLAATGSPYSDALRAGPIEHVSTNIPVAYLYPPPLAQAFVPLVDVPILAIAVVWAATQAVALGLLVDIVYRRYGGNATRTARLWLVIAAAAFQPTLVALYIGT